MNDDRLLIRPARSHDAQALAPLEITATTGITEYVYGGIIPGLTTAEIVTHRFADATHPLSYRSCSVAECDGQVVGFVQAHAYDEEIPPPDLPIPEQRFDVFEPADDMPAPGTYHVNAMAVAEQQRGAGIGRRLLESVFSDAARIGHEVVSLYVFDQNLPAKRLYEKCGFRIVDRRPSLWREPILFTGDLLSMRADLSRVQVSRVCTIIDRNRIGNFTRRSGPCGASASNDNESPRRRR